MTRFRWTRSGGHLIALANPRDVVDYLLALA